MGKSMKSLMLLLKFFASVCVAASLASEPTVQEHVAEMGEGNQNMHSADHISKLLLIEEAVDGLTSAIPAKPTQKNEVKSLGDATPDEVSVRPKGVKNLLELNHLLDQFEEGGDIDEDANDHQLGEGKARKLIQVDNHALKKMMEM